MLHPSAQALSLLAGPSKMPYLGGPGSQHRLYPSPWFEPTGKARGWTFADAYKAECLPVFTGQRVSLLLGPLAHFPPLIVPTGLQELPIHSECHSLAMYVGLFCSQDVTMFTWLYCLRSDLAFQAEP